MSVKYTGHFVDLVGALQEEGVTVQLDEVNQQVKTTSTDDMMAELRAILKDIDTLDKYETLVSVVISIRPYISVKFIAMLFEALIDVEERVWASAGMFPPVRDIYRKNRRLLLKEYDEFAYQMEKGLIDWTKENGFFDNDETYEFIQKRNDIYSRYITLAGEMIG